MNKLFVSAVLAASFMAPAFAFAQASMPTTHSKLIAQLRQLENVGYKPDGSDFNYPTDLQAAADKVAASDMTEPYAMTSVGGVSPDSTSGAGVSSSKMPIRGCAGPFAFCNPYLGS